MIVDFTNKLIEYVDENEAGFVSQDFSYYSISDSVFTSCDFSSACFFDAVITNTVFNGCNFLSSSFSKAALRNITFSNCLFTGTMMDNASVKNARYFSLDESFCSDFSILSSSFTDSSFSSIKTKNVKIEETDLTRSSFFNTPLSFLSLKNSTLVSIRLSENKSELYKAKLDMGQVIDIIRQFDVEITG
mgnify:CR=1 FL=1